MYLYLSARLQNLSRLGLRRGIDPRYKILLIQMQDRQGIFQVLTFLHFRLIAYT